MPDRSLVLIIPAAGSGSRLGSPVPKPFIEIGGKTILEHTLSLFSGIPELREVIVPTSADYLGMTRSLLNRLFPELPAHAIEGGSERYESVQIALNSVQSGAAFVAVHDAVRPFVRRKEIAQCLDAATEFGGAILAIRAKDTIKVSGSDGTVSSTPNRTTLWQAQTPQIFKLKTLKRAYRLAEKERFAGTDDASLVERTGEPVKLVEGDAGNFKITYPLDLKMAEWLIGNNK